jgi:hypothetical protein
MKEKLTYQLTEALETARALAVQLCDSDHTASVCLAVHARVIGGILTDLETL